MKEFFTMHSRKGRFYLGNGRINAAVTGSAVYEEILINNTGSIKIKPILTYMPRKYCRSFNIENGELVYSYYLNGILCKKRHFAALKESEFLFYFTAKAPISAEITIENLPFNLDIKCNGTLDGNIYRDFTFLQISVYCDEHYDRDYNKYLSLNKSRIKKEFNFCNLEAVSLERYSLESDYFILEKACELIPLIFGLGRLFLFTTLFMPTDICDCEYLDFAGKTGHFDLLRKAAASADASISDEKMEILSDIYFRERNRKFSTQVLYPILREKCLNAVDDRLLQIFEKAQRASRKGNSDKYIEDRLRALPVYSSKLDSSRAYAPDVTAGELCKIISYSAKTRDKDLSNLCISRILDDFIDDSLLITDRSISLYEGHGTVKSTINFASALADTFVYSDFSTVRIFPALYDKLENFEFDIRGLVTKTGFTICVMNRKGYLLFRIEAKSTQTIEFSVMNSPTQPLTVHNTLNATFRYDKKTKNITRCSNGTKNSGSR